MFKNIFNKLFGESDSRLYEYQLQKKAAYVYPEPTEEDMIIYNAIVEAFKAHPPHLWEDVGGYTLYALKGGTRLKISNDFDELWLDKYETNSKLSKDLGAFYKKYMKEYRDKEEQKRKEYQLTKLLHLSKTSLDEDEE